MLARMVGTDSHVTLPWVSVSIAYGVQVCILPDICLWVVDG